ncbi:MAG: N4-gp56 family major capsid protein [Clostridium sp.]
MPSQNQTYTNVAGQNQLTNEQAEFYQRALLERLTPELLLSSYAEKNVNIPKNSGDTCSWRRFNSLNVSTTALTEGVTPDAINTSVDKISATVKQYGAYIQTTDLIQVVGLDPVVTQFSELLGEQAGQSIETIIRDMLLAGTNVLYAGGRVSRVTVANTDKITALDILKIRRNFVRKKVKKIKLPNGKMGYLAFAHTDVITDLMQTQEWKDQNTYVDTSARVEGVAGQLYGVYFIEMDMAQKFAGAGASSCDVYPMIVLGKGAFGTPDINGSVKPEMIVKANGSSGTADPLNQRATVGWKALFTVVRLQEDAILRYECSATV